MAVFRTYFSACGAEIYPPLSVDNTAIMLSKFRPAHNVTMILQCYCSKITKENVSVFVTVLDFIVPSHNSSIWVFGYTSVFIKFSVQ